jgi:hypothetical protein
MLVALVRNGRVLASIFPSLRRVRIHRPSHLQCRISNLEQRGREVCGEQQQQHSKGWQILGDQKHPKQQYCIIMKLGPLHGGSVGQQEKTARISTSMLSS